MSGASGRNKHLEAGSNDGLDKILSHRPLRREKKKKRGGHHKKGSKTTKMRLTQGYEIVGSEFLILSEQWWLQHLETRSQLMLILK